MQTLRERIRILAPEQEPVFISGATGTGKDLVARELHRLSGRPGDFVSINCAAVPRDLLESLFFGHERGAFSGAVKSHDGHFIAAHQGTLFLDEVGDMPYDLQSKLLRVVESGMVRKIGGDREEKADVRLICATNRDLHNAQDGRRFRTDLHFRLAVFELTTPGLAERPEDIAELLAHFCTQRNGKPLDLEDEALHLLTHHDWPGNVRELRNLSVRLSVFAKGRPVTVADLHEFMQTRGHKIIPIDPEHPFDLPRTMRNIEWQIIEAAMGSTNEVISSAARVLGVKRSTLADKIKKHRHMKSPTCLYRRAARTWPASPYRRVI